MNRRDFLRQAAIVATGAIAADQLELLDRLTHRRKYFSSVDVHDPYQQAESGLYLRDQDGNAWTSTFNFHYEAWSMSRITGEMKRLV